MTTFRIPITPGAPRFSLETDVREVSYKFTFRFNSRESKWYMDITDPDTDANIRNGVKLVADYPLLRAFLGDDRPQAVFFAIDTESGGIDPETLNDFGERVKLIFQEFESEFPG